MLNEGSDRARARDGGGGDRIGSRPIEYHREVDAAFQSIAAEEPERVQLVDASGSPDAVTDRLIAALSTILP